MDNPMIPEPMMFETIVKNLYDGLYIVSPDRIITYWNKAAERISGYAASEVVGRACADNILTHIDADGHCLCKGRCPLADTMEDGQSRSAEVYLHHKEGHRVPVSVRTTPLKDRDGRIIGGIELFTDISHQAVNEMRVRELERLAFLDQLTELANRHYVEQEIQVRLSEKRRMNIPFGILFMDIDHFKKFNDSYGHDAGDAVLKFTARSFVAGSRPFDLFGRWGGEEFIGVIRNIRETDLEIYGNRIRKLIESSYLVYEGRKLSVTLSLGATLFRDDDTMDSVIKRADHLLYQSKERGRNCLTMA